MYQSYQRSLLIIFFLSFKDIRNNKRIPDIGSAKVTVKNEEQVAKNLAVTPLDNNSEHCLVLNG